MKKTGQFIHKTFNHGKECWKADLPVTFTGRSRVRRYFDTKTEAEQFVKSYHQDIRTFGEEPAAWFHLLTPAQRAKFLVCLQRLDNMGVTLEEAVRMVEENLNRPASVRLEDVSGQFITEKENRGCRPRHMRKIRGTMKLFTANRGETSIADITSADIRDFLNRNGWTAATRKSYLIDLRAFFAFAVRQKYLRDNPADAVEMPILDDKAPGIVSVETCKAVLDQCQRTDPGLLPFAALLFFTGIRTQEALLLETKDVKEDFVEIKAHKAKTRRRRLIPITPQLRAWLDAGLQAGGTLPPKNWQRRWDRVRKFAGAFKDWPQNGARHSFVSYHLAKHKSAAETAAIAGHSEQMLFAHYRELVTPKEADAYFALLPDPNALAEGIEYSKLPKHVPPHLMKKRAEALKKRLNGNHAECLNSNNAGTSRLQLVDSAPCKE